MVTTLPCSCFFPFRPCFAQHRHVFLYVNVGHITYKELQNALKALALGGKEIEQIMQSIDFDHDGVISWHELLAACVHRKLCVSEERLFLAFSRLDANGDGKLTKDEILSGVKHGLGFGAIDPDHVDGKRIADIIAECDTNGDGEIDYSEFLHLFQLNHPITDIVDTHILELLSGEGLGEGLPVSRQSSLSLGRLSAQVTPTADASGIQYI